MAAVAVTYTFANSTTADATQVNQNFSDIVNGTSDGTKDFSINALTCAGTATLNGNVNLGNASADDLTITASLASSISIKTNATYDIGSSTLGLRSIYFGAAGGFTNRVVGGATASHSYTLPATQGSAKSVLANDGSGGLSWLNGTVATVSKTTTYTATTSDDVILCSGSAFTVTLPSASGCTGKVLQFIKTDSSLSNLITIDGNSTETIGGNLTVTCATQYEQWTIVSDGTNWQVRSHTYPGEWVAYTPTFTAAGTVANVAFYSRRVGDSLEVRGRFTCGTVTASTAAISIGYNGTDSNVTIAGTGKIGSSLTIVGVAAFNATGTAIEHVIAQNGTQVVNISNTSGSSTGLAAAAGNSCWANSQNESVWFSVPILNWMG